MTRYCLPSAAPEMTALELIRFEQNLQGLARPYPQPNEGAVALAAWLLADLRRAQVLSRNAASPLAIGNAISRALACEIVPSEPLAFAIALMTLGEVSSDLWDQPHDTRDMAGAGDHAAAGAAPASGEAMLSPSPHPRSAAVVAVDVPGAPGNPATGAPVTMAIDFAGPDGDMSCIAVLGETPPGPLFGVIPPTGRFPFYEVHGLGMSFRLAESGAKALYTALGTAIGVAPGSAAV